MKKHIITLFLSIFMLCAPSLAFAQSLEEILGYEEEIVRANAIDFFEGDIKLTVLSYNPELSPFTKEKTEQAKQTVGKTYPIRLNYSFSSGIIITFLETEHNEELHIQLNEDSIKFYYQGQEYIATNISTFSKAMFAIPYTDYPQRFFALWYNFLKVHDDFSSVDARDLFPLTLKLDMITQAYFSQVEYRVSEGQESEPYDIHLAFDDEYHITEYKYMNSSNKYTWKNNVLSSVIFEETIGNLQVDYLSGTYAYANISDRTSNEEERKQKKEEAQKIKYNKTLSSESEIKSLPDLFLLLDANYKGYDGIEKIRNILGAEGVKSTALIEAIGYDYPEIVSALLSLGADPNIRNVWGYFPLYTAAINGQTQTVNSLIKAGADIYAKTDNGETALFAALDYPETAIALLMHGADPNIGYDDTFPLHVAVSEENEKLVEMLIKYNAYLDLEDGEENTALAIAIKKSNFKIMDLLVSAGADVYVPSQNYLLLAYDYYDNFYSEGVKILCNAGVYTYINHDGRDILDVAIKDNNYNFVHAVAQARKNSYRAHILDFAAKNNEIYLDYELSKGVDINTRDEGTGLTAVAIAAKYGHFELVHFLVEKGADINIASFEGETALWFAAKLGLINEVKYLIAQGANFEIVGNNNINAIEIAAQNGHLEIVEFLLSKSNKDISTFADVYLLAAANGHLDIVKSMLNKGMDINIQDSEYGFTALMLASLNNHKNTVSYLLEKNADMHIKNKNSESIFDLSKYISPSMLEYLNSKK